MNKFLIRDVVSDKDDLLTFKSSHSKAAAINSAVRKFAKKVTVKRQISQTEDIYERLFGPSSTEDKD